MLSDGALPNLHTLECHAPTTAAILGNPRAVTSIRKIRGLNLDGEAPWKWDYLPNADDPDEPYDDDLNPVTLKWREELVEGIKTHPSIMTIECCHITELSITDGSEELPAEQWFQALACFPHLQRVRCTPLLPQDNSALGPFMQRLLEACPDLQIRSEEVQRISTSDTPTSRASGEHNVVIAYEAPQADMDMQPRTYSGSTNMLSVPPTYVGPFVANMMQRAGTALTQVLYGRHPSVEGNGNYAPEYAPGTRGRIQDATPGLARPPASNGGGSAKGTKQCSNAGKAIDREGFQDGEAYQKGRKRRLDPSKGHEEQGTATTSTSPSKRRRTSPPAVEPGSHSESVQVVHGPRPTTTRVPGDVEVNLPVSTSNTKRRRDDNDCEELYTPRHNSNNLAQVPEQQPRPSKRLREDAGERTDVKGTKITGNNTALSQESLTQLTNLGYSAEPVDDRKESVQVEEDTLGMDYPFQMNPWPNIRDRKPWVVSPPRKETSIRPDPAFEFLPNTWDALGYGYYEYDPEERLLASSIPL
ncbi:hypothetical protein GLOTRDRAFT_129385 [Gloeophyllum trabeum ATCC 11539]|uniref:Uncharacterized protein n=1 Tax=Gloeophyllum trabeum (strain ATCC 11539 / FP-39264 / Madison 617) TaxID=670483 RepID=S7RQD0_GLOTA|nr:uncharacterized protein GLOTRDRAFT_129385 [Gloeophyllum trabeum ATCC 11539]EPQ55094.1 hypothetical protein GLOTRDRAFT_129385 [Gloeophyllum trabeum ATCC 11539]